MYRVIEKFRDLTDGHLYEAGDVFPHDGRKIAQDRLAALETNRNGVGRPMIVKAEEPAAEQTVTAPAPRKPRKKA